MPDNLGSPTIHEIRQKLQVESTWITPAGVNFFTTVKGEAIPEGVQRFITQITLTGDLDANRPVTIRQYEDGLTYTNKWANITVAPTNIVQIPSNFDLKNSILTMPGGTDLNFITQGNSLYATVAWWDDEFVGA